MGTTMMQNGKLTDAGKAALAKGKKKRSSSKKAKLQPAVRALRYDLTNSATPGTETSHFIDLARDLSALNRRLYRQGRTYHVKRITVVSSNTPNLGNRISFSTIPTSWVAQGAWKRGMKTWQLMNKEATRNLTNDISAKWQDFKVYMSNDHRASGSVLRPLDNGGNAVVDGEWNYTTLISPDGTTGSDAFDIHMLGDTVGAPGAITSAGLIKSFGNTRATVDFDQPNVPGVASDDPLLNVFDYGTTVDEVIDQLEAENDNAPYSTTDYPGGDVNMVKPLVAQDTVLVDGRATVGGFDVMCGLVEIESTSSLPSDTFSVLVELSAGSYRGIKAEVI